MALHRIYESVLMADENSSGSVDDSHEVGSHRQDRIVSAVKIGRNSEDGPLVFLDDIELREYPSLSRSYYFFLQTADMSQAQETFLPFWRTEYKVPRGGVVKPGHWLIVGELSRTFLIVHDNTFKGPKRQASHAFAANACTYPSAVAFLDAADSHTYDLFETGDRLTAGFSYPQLTDVPGARTNGTSEPYNVLGIVEDLDSAIRELHSDAQSDHLLACTLDGSLKLPDFTGSGPPEITQDAKDAREKLLQAAIMHALAGPAVPTYEEASQKERDDGETTREWLSVPVIELVDEIYRTLLYYYSRKSISTLATVQWDPDRDDRIDERKLSVVEGEDLILHARRHGVEDALSK